MLESDLESEDDEVRAYTVSNLMLHSPPLGDAILLLAKAVSDSNERIRDHAEHALSKLGRSMTRAQAEAMELQVDSSMPQLALQLVLVAYYFLGHRESKAALVARRNHILWLIEHAPEVKAVGRPECLLLESEDAEGYCGSRSLWLAKIKADPNNTSILGNAASFFMLNDSELSEKLLEQALRLEPENAVWHERLGQLHALRAHSGGHHDGMSATKSFAAYEQSELLKDAEETSDETEVNGMKSIVSRIHSLLQLAKSAFDASEFENATNYATELLSLSQSTDLPAHFRNDGNAVHYGSLVLGRVALEMGNVEEAKLRLLASGRGQGAPNLMSFGPNMSLAKDLLECGERDVVLVYFELCRTFWELGSDRLDTWSKEVREGGVPDFGANLNY